jgi:hypothetical protein
MRTQIRLSDLILAEFNVEAVRDAVGAIVVAASGRSEQCRCPTVEPSLGVFIVATLGCLPCAGRRLELRLTVRRFVCSAGVCRRKIFAERFGDDVIRPMARRTARLTVWFAISLSHWAVARRPDLQIVSDSR